MKGNNGPNKEYYNKNQIIVEHGTSKTFYPNDPPADEDELAARRSFREALREKQIALIESCNPREFYKHFPAVINQVQMPDYTLDYSWDHEKLSLEDDINLTFKSNICNNWLKRNNLID